VTTTYMTPCKKKVRNVIKNIATVFIHNLFPKQCVICVPNIYVCRHVDRYLHMYQAERVHTMSSDPHIMHSELPCGEEKN
jgi:hypothetical protein